jgi:hypothetical protein
MQAMLDSAAIAGALRAGIRLRDKVIVLSVDAARDPARIDAIAADLSLARSLGAQVLTVAAAGEGPLPLDAQGPALRLLAALERHGERGVALPAAGLVTVHRIPLAAAAPGVPTMIPVVNTTVLIHLLALGYVPVLFAPAVDAEGGAVDLGAGMLATFVAQFMGAALLVLSPDASVEAPAAGSGLPPVPPIVVTDPASPGRLIADILHHAPNVPVAPAGVAASPAALPSNPTPR